MTLQHLLSYMRRACDDYHMIAPGDKIAVGVSGGKDSLTTLAGMAAMRRFHQSSYTLTAITVDLGFPGFDTAPVREYCDKLEVPYTVVPTDIADIVFNIRKENNPCALCAKMRKGALNDAAIRSGVTKVAYGHNRDDLIHTFFLSLFYEGRMHTCEPVTYLSRTNLHCIRPLMYVPETDVIGFVKKYGLPVTKSPCPVDGSTKREEIKQMVHSMRLAYDHFDEKVFGAIKRRLIDTI